MPSSTAPARPCKPYFYYGHRRPSQNRPVVYGGLFSNRRTLRNPNPNPNPNPIVDFRDWDPDLRNLNPNPNLSSSVLPLSDRRLSPLARHLLSFLRRHRKWTPPLVAELSKLRRVPPHILAEVLRARPPLPPSLSTRFFHWASRQKNFNPSFSSFNALAYSLNTHKLSNAADRIPDLMLASGKNPTEKQLEILVRFHSDAGRGLRVYYVYQRMREKYDIKPRVFLYNRIIGALVDTNHLDLALSVYDDLRADGVKEEAVTFMVIAKGLCRAGRIDRLLEVLDRMRREVCRPDVFAYTAMVKVLAGEGNLDGCLRVWEEIGRDGVVPDVMAYSTLVSGLAKAGRLQRACELFREMKGKGFLIDRAVYGSLVDGFVAGSMVGKGCEVLKEMMDDGYRADLGIYDCLIGGLCRSGKADKAWKLFEIVVQEGLGPGFETVTPLLVSYADTDEMSFFFKFVDRVGELGLPVMGHLANFFTFFVKMEGRELKALDVFEALKGKGYCSIAIYNILIECLHKIKEEKRAVLMFETMKGSKTFEPDSCTYSCIIPCLVDIGDVKEACSAYNKMKEMSCVPTIAAYQSLVRGLCQIGEISAAITLVKDCLGNVRSGPMEFKYTLTVLHACRSRKPEKVVEVLDEMMEQGQLLDDIIYCAVIHGFCNHASSGEARKVFKIMKDRNALTEANSIMYEDLLNEHLKKTAAGLLISGLKFFCLESKLKLTSNSD